MKGQTEKPVISTDDTMASDDRLFQFAHSLLDATTLVPVLPVFIRKLSAVSGRSYNQLKGPSGPGGRG